MYLGREVGIFFLVYVVFYIVIIVLAAFGIL
jgi:hypothetical protein